MIPVNKVYDRLRMKCEYFEDNRHPYEICIRQA